MTLKIVLVICLGIAAFCRITKRVLQLIIKKLEAKSA